MVEFERPELTELKPRISVIGVGGAGGNAVANMIDSGLEGVEFCVANTDAQALAASAASVRLQLGHKITQGLGAGARPEIGRAAAEENVDEIESALGSSHMCFITAGMGGGTGTGAAPVIAQQARERGILTVGVVTKPFNFEGAKRQRAAEAGIAELQKHVDTLIVIPNQNLFMIASPSTTFKEAFQMADQVLHQGVRGITDLMMMPGLINLDFADVRTVMSEMGKAMMGTGEAEGEGRAIEAANKAISNPLLDEVSLRGAKALLINITGGDDMGLMEVDEAANHIREMVDADANIIFGSAFNADLNGKLRVSVVATGIDAEARAEAESLPRPGATRPAFGNVASGFGTVTATSAAVSDAPKAQPSDTAAEVEAHEAHEAPEVPETLDVADADMLEMPEPVSAEVPTDNDADLLPEADDVADIGAEDEPAISAADAPLNETNVMRLRAEEPETEQEAVAEERPYAEDIRPSREAEPAPERGPSLFERMTSIGKGKSEARRAREDLFPSDAKKDNAGEDPLEIPAFFKRQVND
ncbi:cell division protein FtsZ [Pacificimonas sp. WHA3]|uniref:Cell division protein FtsZ n=1 Tax=Pacificimonas pallii TaxID=2827236 RepID=A0ABS6SFL7_9SPHN|nr:cell division protein FtsZ [Pacificimonas pallii]MBV7257204.1 cell division protein FtsZ [Pacificimonas pallii]